MKYRFIFLLAIISLLSFTSCMQDQPNPSDVKKEIKVSATIDGAITAKAKSRATNSSWDEGDAIGIFMKKSGSVLSSSALAINAKYIKSTGTSTFNPVPSNEVYFPFNHEKVDFISYYPHTDELVDLNYPVDVSDQSNLSSIDLLYSNNVASINSATESVQLLFKHQLSNVILNVSLADSSDEDLIDLKAKITNVNTKANFLLVDGSINNENNLEDVSFNMSEVEGKVSGQAILLPTSDLGNVTLLMTLGTKIFKFDLKTATEITSFEKSKKYTFNVTLKPGKDAEVENVTASIEDWVDGGTENVTIDETPPGETDQPVDEDNPGGGGNIGDGDGDGSEENPYSVTQAKERPINENIWVKGYIVGIYEGAGENDFKATAENKNSWMNVAISHSSSETDPSKTFRIEMSAGTSENIKNKVNLQANPNNFGKRASFYGKIVKSSRDDLVILKQVSEAIIEKE